MYSYECQYAKSIKDNREYACSCRGIACGFGLGGLRKADSSVGAPLGGSKIKAVTNWNSRA